MIKVLAQRGGGTPRPLRPHVRLREIENNFVHEYLIDLDGERAGKRCGFRSPAYAASQLLARPRVKELISLHMEARMIRLEIDADFVLSGLVQQYARLTSMLGHDIAALYQENGAMRPLPEWPAVWRERLVSEVQTLEDVSANTAAETAGTTVKIKRESTLAIEREIRTTLELIGRHMRVKAFPVAGVSIAGGNIQLNVVYAPELPAAQVQELQELTEGI